MVSQWSHQTAVINGVSLHFVRTGQGGKPSLVLVHGFSDNGLCWTPVAEALEAQFDIVMPDMRGHGLSARVRPGEAVDMAADLAGLIRQLGLDRPVVVGHSMGAMVTYELGIRFPGLARALVLEDPAWWLAGDPHAPPQNPDQNPFINWIDSLKTKTYEGLLAEFRRDNPGWPESLAVAQAHAKKQLDPAIATVMASRMGAPEAPWAATLPDLTLPTLLFTGDAEKGAIVTAAVVAEVRRLNPRVQVVSVGGVGHLIRFDKLPAFLGPLQEFLNRQS